MYIILKSAYLKLYGGHWQISWQQSMAKVPVSSRGHM